jgi:Protein of unknown function (DUF2857)
MAITVNNESLLTFNLMGFLIQEIQRGNIDGLLKQGISGRVIDQLRGLNAQQMVVLCEGKKPLFGVTICASTLTSALNSIGIINNQADLQSYFVTNGATLTMMREFFKISRESAQEQRAFLCGEPVIDMRRPNEEEQQNILSMWRKLSCISRECERYKALHIALGARFNLRALHYVINRSRAPKSLAKLYMAPAQNVGARQAARNQEQRL